MPALCPLLMALRAVCLTLTELEPLPPGLGWGLGLIGVHHPWLQLKSYSPKASSNEQPSLYIVSLHSWPLLLLPGIILFFLLFVHINCQFPRKLMGSLTAGQQGPCHGGSPTMTGMWQASVKDTCPLSRATLRGRK